MFFISTSLDYPGADIIKHLILAPLSIRRGKNTTLFTLFVRDRKSVGVLADGHGCSKTSHLRPTLEPHSPTGHGVVVVRERPPGHISGWVGWPPVWRLGGAGLGGGPPVWRFLRE